MFTMLNVVYDHFLTRKPSFFTLFMLSRTSYNTTSQNIGGDQCMGCPPTSNFGGTVPQSPLGLRPCARVMPSQYPHASDWLYALPISASSLRLDDETVRVAIGLRFGMAIFKPHVSAC